MIWSELCPLTPEDKAILERFPASWCITWHEDKAEMATLDDWMAMRTRTVPKHPPTKLIQEPVRDE